MKSGFGRDTGLRALRVRTLFFALGFAMAVSACVKVTDEVKATFAPPTPGEVDNYALAAPHGVAMREELTQATVPRADAGMVPLARDVAASEPAMCMDNGASAADASVSPPSNCLHDAGVQ